MPVFSPVPRPPAQVPSPAKTVESSVAETESVSHPVVMVRPLYPSKAREAGIGGDVELEAVIGTDGNVKHIKVISGPAMLISAASDAVRRWRFEPLTINGRPVEFNTRVRIKFSLSEPTS